MKTLLILVIFFSTTFTFACESNSLASLKNRAEYLKELKEKSLDEKDDVYKFILDAEIENNECIKTKLKSQISGQLDKLITKGAFEINGTTYTESRLGNIGASCNLNIVEVIEAITDLMTIDTSPEGRALLLQAKKIPDCVFDKMQGLWNN